MKPRNGEEPLEQGTIINVNLNPVQGHEQFGYRPVVVVSNEEIQLLTGMTMVMPITSSGRKLPIDVEIKKTLVLSNNQSDIYGRVLTYKSRTIDLSQSGRDYEILGTMKTELIQQIINNLKLGL